MTPDWQLPPGVDRGLWDYMSSSRVASEYDDALAGSPLLDVDLHFAERHFPTPGRLIDLGCGTGRLLLPFARRGYSCLGVDLSSAMLEVLREKSESGNLPIDQLQANLVELDAVKSARFDYAACLFSTLGMIRGKNNRQHFLRHIARILKPGGIFIVHVHNARYRFGRGLGKRGTEPGDHTMPQHRGGAELTLHHFTRRELMECVASAGFIVRDVLPVSWNGKLSSPWLLPSVRAYGYLFALGAKPGK